MIRKAIIMAGGTGSRLKPLTLSINKHLLPIYDKPLIYYPLSLMMLLNIREILIIINKSDEKSFKSLLGNGKRIGIDIKYKIQKNPNGIPESFKLAKKFIKNESSILILGDNIFYGQGLIDIINESLNRFNKGAKIFTYPVKNTRSFGIVEIKNKKIIRLREKPNKTYSNLAITGLYVFDQEVIKKVKVLKPSKRNETEIIDLLNLYRKEKKLYYEELGRGSAWLDTGTFRDNLSCSNFIQIIEERQNYKVGCIEEIAFKKKWINKKTLLKTINNLGNSDYSSYLKSLI